MASSLDVESEELDAPDSAAPYRAMCPQAVLSVVAGAASLLTVFSWYFAAVPLLGIWFGWRALKRLQDEPGEWTGARVAQVGIGLSIVFWLLGYGWLLFAGVRSIPYGYQLIQWDSLQPIAAAPTEPPEAATALQDKRIFVKGYMKPRRTQTGIKEFTLCPASGDCPFCIPNPKPTQMIRVVLQGDKETFFTNRMIGAGGRFQVNAQDPSGIPYTLDADCLR